MTRPLLVYNRRISKGWLYLGEQAEIMRLAFSIPDNIEIVVRIK